MLTLTNSQKRKGVNLQEFLTKREVFSFKKETKKEKLPQQKTIHKDVEKEIKKIDIVKIKVDKTAPKTPKIDKPNMFKFFNADKIRNPLKVLEFIEWCAKAPEEKTLKTQNELAIKLGVDINTLSEWKSRAGFWDEVGIYRKQHFRNFTSSVAYGITQKAKTGDPRAVELFLTMFENYKKNIGIEEIPVIREVSDEMVAKVNDALKNIGLASIIKKNKEDKN